MDLNKIANDCGKILQSFKDGEKWISSNLPPEEKQFPVQEMKRLIRKMARLKNTAQKRPAIAVFGPSQVGKSYLISNLVRPPKEIDLFIKDPISGESLSFIKDMNPYGGKESTGTVTRFTTSKNTSEKGYKVKMLCPRDLVCIITNGYYLDIKDHQFKLSPEELHDSLNQLGNQLKDEAQNIFLEDDLYEIKDYLLKSLGLSNNVIIDKLTDFDFWGKSARLAPFLSLDDSVVLFSWLWGKNEFLNGLFRKLLRGLQLVDFTTNIYCDKNALTPNTKTILDVERVRELYLPPDENTKSQVGDLVNINLSNGKRESIDRRILSALTAEIELCLPNQSEERAYLNKADVLDFPGARSREHVPESVYIANTDEAKLQLFVRGKVAYLFDLYNQDFGISTLLYCMDNNNPEVQNIPSLLHNWITSYIGKDADDRTKRLSGISSLLKEANDIPINPLLVVLTKFDVELTGKDSEVIGKPATHNGKWIARLEENFKNFMVRPLKDEWVTDWTNNQKYFKNVFPLRNPSFSKAVFLRDENGLETDVSPEYKKKLMDMRSSFIEHDAVQKHIHDPSNSWDEFAKPNQTGIEYIIRYLSPTCKPQIKAKLIRNAIKSISNDAVGLLEEYFNSEDIDKLLAKAKKDGGRSAIFLTGLVMNNNQFGGLLEQLLITERETWSCYHDIQNAPITNKNSKKEIPKRNGKNYPISFIEALESFGINGEMSLREITTRLEENLGLSGEELEEVVQEITGFSLSELLGESDEEEVNPMDKAMIFTDKVISKWINKVQQLKKPNAVGKEKYMSNLIEELIKTRHRVGLNKILYDAVKEEVDNFSVNGKFDVVARIAFQIINNYVNTFGWYYVKEEARPKNKQQPIFSDRKIDYQEIIPKLEDKFPGQDLFENWRAGAQKAFEANVLAENKIKNPALIEMNQKLGIIIEDLNLHKDAI